MNESNFSNPVKNSDVNAKLTTLSTKAESKSEQDKIVKLQSFDSSHLRGKTFFEDDCTKTI